MAKAVITAEIAPLYAGPMKDAVLVDEALLGTVLEHMGVEERGRCWVCSPCGTNAFMPCEALALPGAAEWEAYGKMRVRAPFADMLATPEHSGARLACVPRGGLLHPLGAAEGEGWLPVALPDGRSGYVKQGQLMPQLSGRAKQDETQLREALATTAMSYLGTPYRRGGKTPLGIDCAGLVAIAYELNGFCVWREPVLKEGLDLHETSEEKLGMGDVIYFDGHAGMYLNDGMYIHATGQDGSDGVVLNSLRPASPFYRRDLAENRLTYASLF